MLNYKKLSILHIYALHQGVFSLVDIDNVSSNIFVTYILWFG